ncbi:hypothetical protein ACFL2J_07600 [Candidatus Omnitrophota bacterium]
MDKKVILFVVILAVIVLFFSSLIIIMDGLISRPSDIISSKEDVIISDREENGSPDRKKYDVFQPKINQDKKRDFQYAPSLEDKFTGKKPVLDI